jgi:GNAT superfamily N-acetyltransferase
MNNVTNLNPDLNEDVFAYQATAEDVTHIKSLILDTAAWLKGKGLSQWNALLEGEDSHNLTGAILRGEVFAFKSRQLNELIGTVILQLNPSAWDFNLWGEGDQFHDSAIYLHRLAVSRSYGGKGLGGLILGWSESGVSFANKDRIRLDCVEYNEHLNQFYRKSGYAFKGIKDGYSRYEKMITASKSVLKKG